ncbi:saccharopine dehydrogenase family protein [Paenibacillus paeoniae]|uniref:Saccharopine dehydrogenase n=1 Tax=Paenibacillus paeoniae TaxID=2292705 RepID=A0A371PNF5_9BACL|nr:saccharopine dehydrogenase NADP-binding domain-containing protein [Paenibacillus paeoniae]REK77721.1 saccharopine dehydrogenase [Paenibacillus paeoniae]
MKRDKIVVIGGYGHVGQIICKELALSYPGKVFAAGKTLARAEAFSRSTDGRVQPMEIDIREAPDSELLSSINLVIMCLDQQNTAFVQACLQQGIRYIDVSADYRFLSQVERLHPLAVSNGATAVLSVGLAPGLTNLLSLQASRLLDSTEEVHISLMLGLGDSHGKAAIEWTIDNLRRNFSTMKQGKEIHHSSFTDGRKTNFGDTLGFHTAYRFNFADQHILPRTLQVPDVSTRLCFDQASMTRLMALLKRFGCLKMLNIPFIRDLAVKLFGSMKIGEPMYALKVDALGKKQNQPAHAECFLQGSHESEVTAKVAAALAKQLYTSTELSHGVYHIEELFQYEFFEEALHGIARMSSRVNVGNSSIRLQ